MKKKLIIFGAGEAAQLAHFYFTCDSDFEVVVFTVDGSYIKENSFCGLPLVAFETIENSYPANEFSMFVALGYQGVNALRTQKYNQAKAKNYDLVSYISSKATILSDSKTGDNCFIFEDNTIQPFTQIGNNVTLWSGNHIGHHATIGDNCFITSHVVVSGGVEIGENCFLGVNATLRDHITIAKNCVVGAGALILADTVENGIYTNQAAKLSKVPSTMLEKI